MLFTEKLRPRIDCLELPLLKQKNIDASVLRLDLIHPVISGNKWFKLKEYVQAALENKHTTIVTFGGAFSNHIVATAAVCKETAIRSIGIIRGEPGKFLSSTLQAALDLGMELFFVDRAAYKEKKIPLALQEKYPGLYLINEGGYGYLGMKGAKTILDLADTAFYTHILCAVGTGTTLAGITESSNKKQNVIGISCLKNNLQLQNQVNDLLTGENQNRFQLIHDFHFGGYAKFTSVLVDFMNDWFTNTGIPSDFVYTGKLLYGFYKMTEQDFFSPGSKILIIHSGGLQGNKSLEKGTLIF